MSGAPKNEITWVNSPTRYLRREKHRPRRNARSAHYAATNALVGDPGTFEPFGATIPADFAALQAAIPTPSPATAWSVTDQHVVLGDASFAYWNGAAWVATKAP